MISVISSLLLFILPTKFARLILSRFRYKIEKGARVGFSWISVRSLYMRGGSRIGHFNFINCERVFLNAGALIQHMNFIRGPFSVLMEQKAQIGNRNVIARAPKGVTWGGSRLHIGFNSKITAGHKLDCCRPIKIGSNSILAGCGSQLWTHGYAHESEGSGRFRIDGPIAIGNNVYIGSACVINAGIVIGSALTVGSHCCVSKNLESPGLYVNGPMRYIDRSPELILEALLPVVDDSLCERVYVKNSKINK